MKSREFYREMKKLLLPVLTPYGFVNTGSRKAVFYRQQTEDVYHIIAPWLVGRGGQWFDLKVMVKSPTIDTDFAERFPDNFGSACTLTPNGLNLSDTHVFRGNKLEGLIRNFKNQAHPALIEHAIPALDQVKTLKDLRNSPLNRAR